MAFKTKLTPLEQTDLLDDQSLALLRQLNITTVEELVGQMQADPAALARVLHVSRRKLLRIKRRALDELAPAVRDALLLSPHGDYALGALDPARDKR
jgi:hypothetical protein